MKKHLAVLLSDFYKQTHCEQYPEDMGVLVSYFTPRMTRLEDEDTLVMFGLQGFIKEYLIDVFNETFFKKPLNEVVREYDRVIRHTLSKDYLNTDKIAELHKLGYLPIKIMAVAEGTKVPVGIRDKQMGVPMIEVMNTHPDFMWVTNFIESIMSCQLWYPMTIANQALRYRKIVNEHFAKTVDDNIPRHSAIAEFGFRGAEGLEGAVLASSAFLTSFSKTATIPAILYLEDYYNCNLETELIGTGMISTEHSVMCSNTAVDGNEVNFIRKLLTEIYPTGNLSMVSDSYDYWNIVDNVICGELKDIITNRQGTLFVRGDSGNPTDIICETVQHLWNVFGGTVNQKGYKVLDNHVRALYGDSITPERTVKIYERLEKDGFAASNVALGAGSFSMQCAEINGELRPFTRDTYSIAVKSTYGELKDGTTFPIFKDPATDDGKFKKSQKGMCFVHRDMHGNITYTDGFTRQDIPTYGNLLRTVFKDGKLVNEESIHTIRDRLHDGQF